jgi:hypothetical protein
MRYRVKCLVVVGGSIATLIAALGGLSLLIGGQ